MLISDMGGGSDYDNDACHESRLIRARIVGLCCQGLICVDVVPRFGPGVPMQSLVPAVCQ